MAGQEINAADREIRIMRTFAAPRDRVFKAWTMPQHVGQWWGPQGFTTTTESMDVRPGGTWRYVMHGPDGTDYQNLITFKGVDAPRRLTYAHGATDEDPEHFQVTVEFEEIDGQTHLNLQMLFPSIDTRNKVVEEHGALDGARQTMARLEHYLKSAMD